MPTQLQNIVQDVRRLWGRLPRSRQLALAITAGVAVAGLLFYLSWSTKPRMVTAYSNLEAKDSAAVVDSLTAQGIVYELAADGTTVRVPAESVDQVRLSLAQQGLPTGTSVGFEIFDKTNFGATDFVQRINYQRSLEGELSRSIDSLDAVESSRVHLVLPKDALLTEQQEPTTASVVLMLNRGGNLTEEQVRGISHLVSHAVQGLEEKNISIVDTEGNLLMDGAALAGGYGVSTTNLELQRQFEKRIELGAQSMLDQVLGPNKARVSVAAELDFDSSESQIQTFSPRADPIIRSAQESTETSKSTTSAPGESPGLDANIPTATAVPSTQLSSSDFKKVDRTTNAEIDNKTEHIIKAPGAVKRLSVSVVIDEKVPEAQMAALQSAIAAAVGLDNARGDQLAVTRIPFDATALEAASAQTAVAAGGGMMDMVMGYVKLALPLLALVGFFVFYKLMLRSLGKRREAWASMPSFSIQELPNSPELEERTVEARRREMNVERVATLARQQPAAVAEIVQSWIREGGN